MIYILRDDFDGFEELARLKAQFPDPTSRELNTTVLDGRNLDLGELVRACEAPPFLADRRLVIVRRLLVRFQPKNARQAGRKSQSHSETSAQENESTSGRSPREEQLISSLCSFLQGIPEFVDLAFVEDVNITSGNPVYKIVEKSGGKIVQRAKPLRGQELVDWITERARKKGGKIANDAAQDLAAFGSEDLRTLDGDLEKLVVHAGDREITPEDVRALVSDAREANVFVFVDAVSEGNVRVALNVLHELLFNGATPVYLLSMITRQYRLLIQVRELERSVASPDEVASRLQVHRFVAQKTLQQARRFSMERLERAYRSLTETDVAIKTGLMDADVALDLLVIELALKGGQARHSR